MHSNNELKGFKKLDKSIPAFTIFAFEEPENHLSPYYLGRVLKLLTEKCDRVNAVGLVTTHSASVARRIPKVEQIRYFRQSVDGEDRSTSVSRIVLPSDKKTEDYKYLNQAVLAHPEIYFSKLVILGEGDSEEIIIPRMASKLGFDLDPSFVAFAKLGGRHVNHMWRLLEELHIPYITLLDLDWGRYQAGPYRIKNIIDKLQEYGAEVTLPTGLKLDDLRNDTLSKDNLKILIGDLEKNHNVFFSSPLDLDMSMIKAFPVQYGVDNSVIIPEEDANSLRKKVLKEGDVKHYSCIDVTLSNAELKIYDNLFGEGKSKVSSHYAAIDSISLLDEIKEKCPPEIIRMIKKAAQILGKVEDE